MRSNSKVRPCDLHRYALQATVAVPAWELLTHRKPDILAISIQGQAAGRSASAMRCHPRTNRQEMARSMVRKSIEQRLAELEARRTTLKARLGQQERARDTRRKVLQERFPISHFRLIGNLPNQQCSAGARPAPARCRQRSIFYPATGGLVAQGASAVPHPRRRQGVIR